MSKIFPGNKRKTPGRKPNGRPVVQFRTRQLKFAGWVEGQKLSYPGRLMSARASRTVEAPCLAKPNVRSVRLK